MNLFIDTNVFLSFYHYTSDDLEQLRKLKVLIENGDVTLFLPTQVRDEFRRNREKKISEAIRLVKDQKLNLQFPQLCKDYKEYDELRRLQREYEVAHAAMLKQIDADLRAKTLGADTITDELFALATIIEADDDILDAAQRRDLVGNPPGKKGSLGDAINWEALLSDVPDGEDLYLVSADGDFASTRTARRSTSSVGAMLKANTAPTTMKKSCAG